jgi:hypothetical protein
VASRAGVRFRASRRILEPPRAEEDRETAAVRPSRRSQVAGPDFPAPRPRNRELERATCWRPRARVRPRRSRTELAAAECEDERTDEGQGLGEGARGRGRRAHGRSAIRQRGRSHLQRLHHTARLHRLHSRRGRPALAPHQKDYPQGAPGLVTHGHRHRVRHGHRYGSLRWHRHHPSQLHARVPGQRSTKGRDRLDPRPPPRPLRHPLPAPAVASRRWMHFYHQAVSLIRSSPLSPLATRGSGTGRNGPTADQPPSIINSIIPRIFPADLRAPYSHFPYLTITSCLASFPFGISANPRRIPLPIKAQIVIIQKSSKMAAL